LHARNGQPIRAILFDKDGTLVEFERTWGPAVQVVLRHLAGGDAPLYRKLSAESGLVDGAHFRRWFDLIGLQRHIKVLGLFCRLNYRDAKASYLADLPLVLDYVLGVARLYPDLTAFAALIERAVGDRDITRARAADSAAAA